MKLERITAESWVNAFSIMLLMYAAGAAVSGIIYLLLGIFAPASAMSEEMTKMVAIVMGVLGIIIAPLLHLWGRGLWQHKPWARILLLVFAWIAAAVAILAFVLGIILLTVNTEFGRSQLLGTLVIIVALLLGAYAGFALWLFMHADIAAVFGKPQEFAWNDETRAGIIRGWALMTWISAAMLVLGAVLFALASPFLANAFMDLAPMLGYSVSMPVAIGVLLFIAALLALVGVIMHFVSKGMWNFRNWARIVLIVFAWISLAFALIGFVSSLVRYEGVTAVASSLSDLIYGGGIAALQIWFLQFAAKELFVVQAAKQKAVRRRH